MKQIGTSDGKSTAAALLGVGRRLFAEHGYEGTSVRQLTAEAGVNLGAVTYHFGSKRELYDAVVGAVMSPLAERLESVVSAGGAVLDRVEQVVRTYFGYLAENPDMPKLMLQELALGGLPSMALGRPMSRAHGALTKLVREGQERGEIPAGDAPVMAVFMMSVPVHLAVVQGPLRTFAGVDVGGAAGRQRALELAAAFVRRGLSAESAG
jgi:TetR/AcrR family transcriptional regulator